MITQAYTENRSFTLSELVGQDENAFERYLQEKDQFLDRMETDAQQRVARHVLQNLEKQIAWSV
jgi:hypothetical protein